MTKDKLVELKDAAEANFNTLLQEIKQLDAEVVAKNTELTKLQGDFRTLESLISQWEEKPEEVTPPNAQEAEVVNG